MEKPELEESNTDSIRLGTFWTVRDAADFRRKFCLPAVLLSHSEWLLGYISRYDKRASDAREKYKKWLAEVDEDYK